MKELEGRWMGSFNIPGFFPQYITLDITVAADGTFKGKALDNNVPEVVTGEFTANVGQDLPYYDYQIHIYGPTYGSSAQLMPDDSLQMHGDVETTLTKPTPEGT